MHMILTSSQKNLTSISVFSKKIHNTIETNKTVFHCSCKEPNELPEMPVDMNGKLFAVGQLKH